MGAGDRQSIVKPKLGSVVADAIEAEIVEARWPVGVVLATEAQLVGRFGVSRATVREAIGQLERRGIAAMRAGKKGGLVVSAPAKGATVRALATFMELADVNIEDILTVRMMLEQQAASLAAERITDEEADALREYTGRLDRRDRSIEEVVEAHATIRKLIATASHNPLLELFIDALSLSASDVIRSVVADMRAFDEVIVHTGQIKQKLVEAIIAYDKFEAQRLSRDDVTAQLQGFRDLRMSEIGSMSLDWNDARLKLPQSIAVKISRHIADHGLVEGDKLGAEPDLQKRFGVSRSVLREAIRMLESYSIVRMRRGFGGGLMVGSPDPASTIASVVRFLRSMDISWRDLFEIREVLEPAAVELAARRSDDGQRARFAEALRDEDAVRDDPDPVPTMTRVHKMISEAAGNHVLALLVKVVIDTTASSYDPPSPDGVMRILRSHRAIISAIIGGEAGLARRRIFDHLLFLSTMGEHLSLRPEESALPRSLRNQPV